MLNLVLGRSVHKDLIGLHLGHPVPARRENACGSVAATRWIVAPAAGVLAEIKLPSLRSPEIHSVELLKSPGDGVSPPYHNADRLGCILALGSTRGRAEQAAEDYLSQIVVRVQAPTDPVQS